MMTGVEKLPLVGKVSRADSDESRRRFDELFSPRMALVSFILVTGANIALLSVIVRQHLKETSLRC